MTTNPAPGYVCHVFDAGDMRVVAGANTGDPLAPPDEICLGDVYEFTENARALILSVQTADNDTCSTAAGQLQVAQDSEIGTPGTALSLAARLTFMAPDGGRAELVLIALGDSTHVFLPLSPLDPVTEYTAIAASHDPGPVRLSNITSVAFTRGTRITMADGTQRPVEQLFPGDLVLTRGNGPQPLRHLIARTVRATGAFAPVAIPKGTLGNANDLVLSQHQRLFIYQRGPNRITDRAELLVRARDLVDGENVTIRKGGYADYVSLVFDQHEVIYAECIPAESLLVNDTTRRDLPEDALEALHAALPDIAQAPVRADEASSDALAAARARFLRGAGQS